MQNRVCECCGGCVYRSLKQEEYRKTKVEDFRRTIEGIAGVSPVFDEAVFVEDGARRRADMAFAVVKKEFKLGFNEAQSHNLVDVENCPMLHSGLNAVLPALRAFLQEFCSVTFTVKNKKKKTENISLREGSVKLLLADNGIDILLQLPAEPVLEHRLAAADFVNAVPEIIRLSWSVNGGKAETVVEKMPPELYIAGYNIPVPHNVFLQASKAAENAMIAKVTEYMGQTTGKIADLFCGLGTFTYPLAKKKENEVIAADSSSASLEGLQNALNRNQIQNVKVINRNLFKDPLDEQELSGVRALVIDPPRAGAHEQCRVIARMSPEKRPQKIVFVSCNPKTFAYDAGVLIDAGYDFERVTLIDQFVYSKHQELIALFTLNAKK